jgi:hypothetical protein
MPTHLGVTYLPTTELRVSLFSPRSLADPAQLQRIKTWARELLTLNQTVDVLVTEVRCTEPGCPPTETMIALLHGPGDTEQYTLHKPLSAVQRDDLIGLQPKAR